MKLLPTVLLCVVAAFFLLVGFVDISYSRFDDLPWAASFVEGIDDPSQFDRPIQVLTNWIGILLIVVACTLLVLALNLRRGAGYLVAAGILSVGTLLGQVSTLWIIGAPTALLALPTIMVLLSLTAVTLARRRKRDDA